MDQLHSPFEAMGAAFIIEEPASLSEYGLDDPVCTIELTTEGGDYTILLGDYSTMDEQRYVSIGDGKVYLAVSDPLDEFDTTLADLIQNDAVPDFETVTAVTFSGRRTIRSPWRRTERAIEMRTATLPTVCRWIPTGWRTTC